MSPDEQNIHSSLFENDKLSTGEIQETFIFISW